MRHNTYNLTGQQQKRKQTGNLETENQMPFNKQWTRPVFPAHGFHTRLVKRRLFADRLKDLGKGIRPCIAVEKTLG